MLNNQPGAKGVMKVISLPVQDVRDHRIVLCRFDCEDSMLKGVFPDVRFEHGWTTLWLFNIAMENDNF